MTSTMRWLTPIGDAAIAVLRLEGAELPSILARHLERRLPLPLGALALRRFFDRDGALVDEVLLRRIACSHGRVLFELCAHGGIETSRRLASVLLAAGVSLVPQQAEHTSLLEEEIYRAFLAARSKSAARFFLTELARGTPVQLRSWLESGASCAQIAAEVRTWRTLYRSAHAWVQPPRVVLVGPVNAGKSSLLNALANDERAIVSPIAGTTRDPLRAEILIDDYPIELWDTAGFGGARPCGSALEQAAIELSRTLVARADLLIELLDATAPDAPRPTLPAAVPRIVIASKSDLARAGAPAVERSCSARTGAGLRELEAMIATRLGLCPSRAIAACAPFLPRHLEAIDRLSRSQDDCRATLQAWLGEHAGCACGS
ncbi:MAG: GTPase [Planctomycetota bacterium]